MKGIARSPSTVMNRNGAVRSTQGHGSRDPAYRLDKNRHGKCRSLSHQEIIALGYKVAGNSASLE